MNKINSFIFLFTLIGTISVQAQTRETFEERRELLKMSKVELNEKATKASRKEAKRLQKEGFVAAPGALPIEKQLDRSYTMQMQFDDDGFPKYLMGNGSSIGQSYDAAKMQAMEMARQDLAAQIQTEIAAVVKDKVQNGQLPGEEAASLVQTVQESGASIHQNIGRIIPVFEVQRTLKNKKREVSIRIAYNAAMAKQAAKKAIMDDMNSMSEELKGKLDQVMGW